MIDVGRLEAHGALRETLQYCTALLHAVSEDQAGRGPLAAASFSSLLDRCELLTEGPAPEEPIRLLQHFACTGGTLIAKCIASMPNTGLLSEVEPFSALPADGGRRFFPSDLIQLIQVGTYPGSEKLIGEVFLRGLTAIYEDSVCRGIRLVLRDHAHSRYCTGAAPLEVPLFAELVSSRFPVKAVVLVRHPIDSFLSLSANGWMHFEPTTFDEYSGRYLQFLADTEPCEIFRYEDFVSDPMVLMRSICDALRLPCNDGFLDLFPVHSLSGTAAGRRAIFRCENADL